MGFDGVANHLFRVAETIDGGRVDPVDAEIEGAVNGAYGIGVILRAPGELPVPSADGPGAESDGG